MHIYPFAGTWNMVHDNWTGILEIDLTDQEFNEIEPPCQYHSVRIEGHYSPGGGGALAVEGTIGGRDLRHIGHQCPQSDHKIAFTIAFPGAAPQPFEGYFFTQEGPPRMAGYTWWQGTPFGWSAQKQ